MYEYIPKRKNKKAAMTTLLLSAAAAVCFFGVGLFGPIAATVQVVGLILAAVAILIAGRYLLKDYVYSLSETETGVDLTVTELQGKRRVAVCRIGLEDLDEVLTETAENRETVKSRLKDVKRYDYCVDLSPERSLHLCFCDRGQDVAVRIVPDERMEELIHRYTEKTTVERSDGIE